MAQPGWYADDDNETLKAIANILRNPLGGDPMSKRAAAGNTIGELLFGQAPQELDRWARGNKPFKLSDEGPRIQMNPSYDENTGEPTNRGVALVDTALSAPIGTAMKGVKAAGPAAAAMAGVVKPKGGDWVGGFRDVQEAFRPKPSGFTGGDPETQEILANFQEKFGADYDKKVQKWAQNLMGTADDPLIKEYIGETPYTFGELGDLLVHKADPTGFRKRSDFEEIMDPQGNYVKYTDPETGRREYLTYPVERYEYSDPQGKVYKELSDRRDHFAIEKWMAMTPEERANKPLYMTQELENAVKELLKSKKKVRPDVYEVEKPLTNPETGEVVINPQTGRPRMVAVSGKKLPEEELPEWGPVAGGIMRPQTEFTRQFNNIFSDIGMYGGNPEYFKEPNLGSMTLPDLIRKWPQKYDIAERQNREKNAAGLQILDIPMEDQKYLWAKVTEPEALRREGRLMRSCVGGYCDDLERGDQEFYTLRDKQFMSPKVTSSMAVEKQSPFMGEHFNERDVLAALRNPEAWARDYNRNLPQGTEILQNPELVRDIRHLYELRNNDEAYRNYLDQRPELNQLIQNHDGQELLRRGLPQYARELEVLFDPTYKSTRSFREVKGSANHPVAPRYREAVGAFLRKQADEGVEPGSLTHGEAKYAGHLPMTDPQTGKTTYVSEGEVRPIVAGIVDQYLKADAEGRMQMAAKYGNNAMSHLRSIARNVQTGALPENIVKNLDLETIGRIIYKDPRY